MSVCLGAIDNGRQDHEAYGCVQFCAQVVNGNGTQLFGLTIGVVQRTLYYLVGNVGVRSIYANSCGSTRAYHARFGVFVGSIRGLVLVSLG